MGILDLFRSGGAGSRPDGADTDTVQQVMATLHSLPPERARYLAAFAYLLGRVAYADRDFQPTEAQEIARILQERGIPTDEVALVVDIVKQQNELRGRTEDYLVTREFREVSTRTQRLQTLDCLFAVAAADDTITGEEEAVVAQIANELGLTHREVVDARIPYSAKRSVFS